MNKILKYYVVPLIILLIIACMIILPLFVINYINTGASLYAKCALAFLAGNVFIISILAMIEIIKGYKNKIFDEEE